MKHTVLGIFQNHTDAKKAIQELDNAGLDPKDLSVVMKNREEGNARANSTGANIASSAVTGGTTGAVMGGIAGLLMGIGAVTIPGVSALFVAEPLASLFGLSGATAITLSGVFIGAAAGGIIGALIGLGMPEEEAAQYEEQVKAGGILLAIPVHGTGTLMKRVKRMLQMHHAHQIKTVEDTQEITAKKEQLANEGMKPAFQLYAHPTYAYAPVGYKGGKSRAKKRKNIIKKGLKNHK